MSSLREIKDRIGSVRSTLKITSAMKLVASAKLRKAQKTIEGMRPYESALNEILTEMLASSAKRGDSLQCGTSATSEKDAGSGVVSKTVVTRDLVNGRGPAEGEGGMERSESFADDTAAASLPKVAVVAIASNSSLCGGFNGNVIKKALETVHGFADEGFEVEVHAVGRKMAEAMRKAGYESPADYFDLIGHPEYSKSAALATSLCERFDAGELAQVVIVYNHFVTTSKQEVVVEPYLPFAGQENGATDAEKSEYIIEPSAEEVVKTLMPQVMMLKFHSAVLDSAAAEHAARTVAMQTATDNAQDLLGELTLEYNKGRQQKITSEILDLLGGAQ